MAKAPPECKTGAKKKPPHGRRLNALEQHDKHTATLSSFCAELKHFF